MRGNVLGAAALACVRAMRAHIDDPPNCKPNQAWRALAALLHARMLLRYGDAERAPAIISRDACRVKRKPARAAVLEFYDVIYYN